MGRDEPLFYDSLSEEVTKQASSITEPRPYMSREELLAMGVQTLEAGDDKRSKEELEKVVIRAALFLHDKG